MGVSVPSTGDIEQEGAGSHGADPLANNICNTSSVIRAMVDSGPGARAAQVRGLSLDCLVWLSVLSMVGGGK